MQATAGCQAEIPPQDSRPATDRVQQGMLLFDRTLPLPVTSSGGRCVNVFPSIS